MRIEGLGEERLRYIFGQLLAADPRFELCDGGVRLREDARERLPLSTLEFAVLDTETTGGSPRHGHRVIEVAAVRVRDGRPGEHFSTLLDPGRPIPQAITRLTGISRLTVAGAPTFERAAPGLLAFIGDAVVVAHNAPFDRAFLQSEFRRAYNRSLISPFLCTVRLARRLAPGLPSYRLDVLASHFGITVRHRHRALGDAEATAEILCRLLEGADPFSMHDLRPSRRSAARPAPAFAR